MRLIWSPRALRDIDDIIEFHSPDHTRAGIVLCQLAMESATQLVDFPELGAVLHDEGGESRFRHLVVRHLRLIYTVREDRDQVRILRVWDARRNPDRLEIVDDIL